MYTERALRDGALELHPRVGDPPGQAIEEGGLPRPAGSHDGRQPARLRPPADTLQDGLLAPVAGQPSQTGIFDGIVKPFGTASPALVGDFIHLDLDLAPLQPDGSRGSRGTRSRSGSRGRALGQEEGGLLRGGAGRGRHDRTSDRTEDK